MFWLWGVLASQQDPVGLVYAPATLGKRQAAFTGTLGGPVPAIIDTGDAERPYGVNGNTFTDYESAAGRSCNDQFGSCQQIANTDRHAPFSLPDCQDQLADCLSSASATDMSGLPPTASMPPSTVVGHLAQTVIPFDEKFDLICDLPVEMV
ncbi:hypothetical protein BDV25DRAFT_137661 [Aspergillus avenaceus]|uniref:Uncharacterized protein n=1 Tax=Aspergillus avenaceus TaxID=36643 RepID=A0A5N6U2S5_ASPAV|nr:hypothetical protein BDV25DRAFT_137661 [Aspergillus avenaceus]